jgi:hypothetical protein
VLLVLSDNYLLPENKYKTGSCFMQETGLMMPAKNAAKNASRAR